MVVILTRGSAMAYDLKSDTKIEIRKGMQSAEKKWNQIAFEYLGVKDAKRVGQELVETGKSEWEGFVLFHPDYKS